MQDQVHDLHSKGISSVYLGSAQLNKQVEESALSLEGNEKHICDTWMDSKAKQDISIATVEWSW